MIQRIRDCRIFIPNQNTYHTFFPQGLGAMAEEGQKEYKSQKGSFMYKLTGGLIAFSRSQKAYCKPTSSVERGGRHKIEPLAEELFIIDNYWERKSPFSLGM